MSKKKDNKGLTVKKENFSEWYSQVLEKAEIADIRTGIKGFIAIRPWGTLIIEKMYDLYESELQKKGHQPTIMPSVIPESNLKQEASHIKGFTPEVFWLEKIKEGKDGKEEKLALRPTSETLYTPMFKLWVRSHRDLPMKLYQRGSVFRFDTKSTRPLIRGREFQWIETHCAFATKQQAESQVQQDIETTENIMHKKLGIPFLALRRPAWDKFAGAEYTIGSDVLMPDGKLIQQPSTHMMGQTFSKAFGATFKTEQGKEDFLWTTAYGPAMSRILVSVISTHGDDKGLVLPFEVSPIQVIIIPIYKSKNKTRVLKYAKGIKDKLKHLRVEIDDREEQSVGWKFNEWELKGVPFRIEIGEKEINNKQLTIFVRDTGKKTKISIGSLEKLGKSFDDRLRKKADKYQKENIVNCKNKEEIKRALNGKKIAKVNFCSTNAEGEKCAAQVEKDLQAEIRGSVFGSNSSKRSQVKGKCAVCSKPAHEVVYIGKSY